MAVLKNQIAAVKEEKSYGTLRLSSKDYPEVSEMTIGDVKECTITTKVTALRKADRWEIQDKQAKVGDIFASVEITKIVMKDPKPAHKGKKTGDKKTSY